MIVKRAALALMRRANGDVLAVSRKTDHEDLGLPGGKVDFMETPAEAVVREVSEETGCIVTEYQEVYQAIDAGGYLAITFLVSAWEGEPRALEAGAVRWVPPERLLEPSCSFREYNRGLFSATGVLPPETAEG